MSIERLQQLAGLKSPFDKPVKKLQESKQEEVKVLTESVDDDMLEAVKHFSVMLIERQDTLSEETFNKVKEGLKALKAVKKKPTINEMIGSSVSDESISNHFKELAAKELKGNKEGVLDAMQIRQEILTLLGLDIVKKNFIPISKSFKMICDHFNISEKELDDMFHKETGHYFLETTTAHLVQMFAEIGDLAIEIEKLKK